MQMETPRLLLRPWRERDADDLYEYARDPRVGPPAGWPTHGSREESLSVIRTVFTAPNVFALVLKESGKVVGSAGYANRRRAELPGPDDELGYALNPAYWGRGLMPEAARELVRYGFEEMGLNTVWCAHNESNHKSRRVIEKVGFVYRLTETAYSELMGEERTSRFYALTKGEWRGYVRRAGG